jgi:hypothetical protein
LAGLRARATNETMGRVQQPADKHMLSIAAALEALELGDVSAAETILLGVREDGSAERRYCCSFCPASYEWPGELERHVVLQHEAEEAA